MCWLTDQSNVSTFLAGAKDRGFSKTSRSVVQTPQLSFHCVSSGAKLSGREATLLDQVPRLRINGAVPPISCIHSWRAAVLVYLYHMILVTNQLNAQIRVL